ncbi:helix-turn-helix domain-containing protein [Aquimarina sp. 2201CG14-23]|uniref:helix-turn-helix domain-containing protein n=1 Tax=Aquimarina mycalae TaxID=3040073 RepID=UPI002477DEA3|nr:helix-turn-helix domain-containing protein [Aquimarina sp. 2201CG14-23]MDH7446509.1 helix-turn-helix domain-containing protein [Aquimarina sp. 2201CG14-23]
MPITIPLEFPSFNLYSTPLLLLVLQAFIFASLLLIRYFKKKYISALILALLIFITGYHRTTYTIGFMDWYDTYRNTKINYWLIALSLAIGPLLYFYVKSITTSNFKFRKKDFIHFVPVSIYVLYKIAIFIYDSVQPGFNETQNGYLKIALDEKYVNPLVGIVENLQMLLYLAFTIQLYFMYKRKIQQFFSNTYRLELNWIRNFLFIYSFLFLYSVFEGVIGSVITDLHWTQRWWYQFFTAVAIIYIGIKGYFTDTNTLNNLNFSVNTPETDKNPPSELSEVLIKNKERIQEFMEKEKPFLNPDLNLTELSKMLNIPSSTISDTINSGFHKNFNDFVNSYRVQAVQMMLQEGKQQQLSLLGIAYECGFNSKATFNRVFKKLTDTSPSQYLAQQNNS